jgi:hypothetical protein
MKSVAVERKTTAANPAMTARILLNFGIRF